jgi:glutathione synthase/RimK-type ligase-like ATP-grasp enzyme
MDRKIAFVTYQKHPAITADDSLAKTPLFRHGIDVVGIPWDDPIADWTQFDAVVLRSCWDYFHHAPKFFSWIDRLESQHVKLINDYATVRWNAEKTYLRDLLRAGAEVVPTVYAPRNSSVSIAEVIREQKWQRAVIKPAISGTSLHTWVSSALTLEQDQRQLNALLTQRNMMLQEYLPEIESDGELSLIYFDEQYSHAVRKVPRQGDFRVQSDFGGTTSTVIPDTGVRRQADEVLQAAARKSVYARVDGVIREGIFLVMELELVEPHLFLDNDPGAAERFAEVLTNRVSATSQTEPKTY